MYLLTCLKKLFGSLTFWAGVLGTAVICMLSGVYFNPQNGQTESVIAIYSHYTKEALLQNVQFSFHSIFSAGLGSWLKLFMPVIVSIAVVNIKLDEQGSGIWRFTEHRIGKWKYHIGTCLFYLLSGGLTLLFGYGLFGLIVYLLFPPLSEYPVEQMQYYLDNAFWQESIMQKLYLSGGLPLTVVMQLAEIFLYGAVGTAVSLLLSSFADNKYVIICTPFFLKYVLNQFCTKLIYSAYADQAQPKEWLGEIASIIDPEAVTNILSYSHHIVIVLLLNVGVVLLSGILYCVIRNRRESYGL